MTEEAKKYLTTIFAVRTTIGRERTVQDLILNRLRTINPLPDLKAIVTSEQYRGFVFIEAIHQHDVVHVTNNLIHVKGKVVGSIPFDDIEAVIKPEKTIKTIEKGDIVEITSGVFQNSKANVIKMPKEGGKEEVTVRLLDSESSVTIKIHADFIKLVEKVKRATKVYTFTEDTSATDDEVPEDGEIIYPDAERYVATIPTADLVTGKTIPFTWYIEDYAGNKENLSGSFEVINNIPTFDINEILYLREDVAFEMYLPFTDLDVF